MDSVPHVPKELVWNQKVSEEMLVPTALKLKLQSPFHHHHHTVDGQNPAPPGMVKTL